jgi:hypothetical protein
MSLSVGDFCEHKYYSWVGKCEIKSINSGICELMRLSDTQDYYYSLYDLKPWEDVKYTSEYAETPQAINLLYCTCTYADAKITDSSTQVQASVEDKDKFKFCRTCKKERK